MDKEVIKVYKEVVTELTSTLKSRMVRAERLTILVTIVMLVQTSILLFSIFYFLNNFEVEMETTTIEQQVEGEGNCIYKEVK